MNLSNENRLLLYCTKIKIPEDTLNKVKDIVSLPLNWEEVLASAFWYGITPLLYHNLNKIQENNFIPKDVMDKLKKAYHGNDARNMYLYKELKRILEAFCENGVKVIVLKGATLAKTVYGDIALRPMCDIDLLVKKVDLPYAEKIISELGYLSKDNKSPEWYRINYHIHYIPLEKDIHVEIHWHIAVKHHLFRLRNIDTNMIESWWERAKEIELFGNKTLILCPEDLVFHLCHHFLTHRFLNQKGNFSSRSALIQICDIFQTIKLYRDEINWIEFKYTAEKYGIESLIYTTLSIAREIIEENDGIFDEAISVFTLESLDKKFVRLINKRIFMRDNDLTVVPPQIIQLQMPHTFYEIVKTLLRCIFPNSKGISKRYNIPSNSKRVYFYYLIRPFILPLKHRKIISKIPRIKEDAILERWISGKV